MDRKDENYYYKEKYFVMSKKHFYDSRKIPTNKIKFINLNEKTSELIISNPKMLNSGKIFFEKNIFFVISIS